MKTLNRILATSTLSLSTTPQSFGDLLGDNVGALTRVGLLFEGDHTVNARIGNVDKTAFITLKLGEATEISAINAAAMVGAEQLYIWCVSATTDCTVTAVSLEA